MKPGDLISFKPKASHEDDWSAPAIVLRPFLSDSTRSLWVAWCEGRECLIYEEDCDILFLITS
jgi:hypothetical protein